MAQRPFADVPDAKLRDLAGGAWGDPRKLRTVWQELSRRDRAAAAGLCAQVRQRFIELVAGSRPASEPDHAAMAMLAARITEIERERDLALARAEAAEHRLRQAGARAAADGADEASLFAVAGLHPNAPGYLLAAARQAHARALHPDANTSRPRPARLELQRRLGEINAALDRLTLRRRATR